MRKQQFCADEVGIRRGLWGTGKQQSPGRTPREKPAAKADGFCTDGIGVRRGLCGTGIGE